MTAREVNKHDPVPPGMRKYRIDRRGDAQAGEARYVVAADEDAAKVFAVLAIRLGAEPGKIGQALKLDVHEVTEG
jgi:hypothetical protein